MAYLKSVWVHALLGLLYLLGLCRGDNFHTLGHARIVCNGEELDVPCTQTRWKISYLGVEENIQIDARENTVYITGAEKTLLKEKRTPHTIVRPKGYNIVLHSDKVYGGGIPEKVAVMGGTVLVTVFLCGAVFMWVEKCFK
ncbi:hypothetical protein NECID01_1996 [Nematocida sp. AWRm77]|nr:hypothetical protein NECID01_1996 [Nematocida sp. AWRm77]